MTKSESRKTHREEDEDDTTHPGRRRQADGSKTDGRSKSSGAMLIVLLVLGVSLVLGAVLFIYFGMETEPEKGLVEKGVRQDQKQNGVPKAKDDAKKAPIDVGKPQDVLTEKRVRYSLAKWRSEKPFLPLDPKNPGTLDQLDRAKIPSEDLLPWYPKELVAILGSSQGYVDSPGYGSFLVGFTPDAQHIVTAGPDGLRLWAVGSLINVGYLSTSDLGGAISAANMSPGGQVLTMIPNVGFVEVNIVGESLKIGRTLSMKPNPQITFFDYCGIAPDNSFAWQIDSPSDQIEIINLDRAKTEPTLIPLLKKRNGERVFADSKSKRVVVVSQTNQGCQLEVWSLAGPKPERKVSTRLKIVVHTLAFGEAPDSLAVGAAFEEWALLKLQGDRVTVTPGPKLPLENNHLSHLQFVDEDRKIHVMCLGAISLYDIMGKPVLKGILDLGKITGADRFLQEPGAQWTSAPGGSRLASMGKLGDLRIWESGTSLPKLVTPPLPLPIDVLSIPRSATRIITRDGPYPSPETIHEWDLSNTAVQISPVEEALPLSSNISADGQLRVRFNSGSLEVDSRARKGPQRVVQYSAGNSDTQGSFSPGGRWLTIGSLPMVVVDLTSERLQTSTIKDTNWSQRSYFSRNDQFLLVDTGSKISRLNLTQFPKISTNDVFDLEGDENMRGLHALSSRGNLLLVDRSQAGPAGECLIVPADKQLEPITRSDEGKISNPGVVTLKVKGMGPAIAAAFSPNDRFVVRADQFGLKIFNTNSGELVKQFPTWGTIRLLQFAEDGRHLIVANGNNTIFVLRLNLPTAE